MRECQQKLLKSESKIVMCNWDRGSGKTYSIIRKILQEGGNWVFITKTCNSKKRFIFEELIKYINNYSYYNSKIKTNNNNLIEIDIINGDNINIYFESPNTFRNSVRYDYVVFDDEKIDLDIIREVKANRGFKQVIITTTMDDFQYISDERVNTLNIDKNEWINQQIKELMVEFSNIRKDERTTITREKILGMIKQLESMRNLD